MSWDIGLEHRTRYGPLELAPTVNYTHNTNGMIRDAGLKEWPQVSGWLALRLHVRLERAIRKLERRPAKYRAMNPGNGWGDYDSLLPVLRALSRDCREYPLSRVWASY